MNLANISVKRPTLIVVIFATLSFLGFMSMRSLNYELLPKFSAPIFTIVTVYPGASPVEVENGVSRRIEEQVSGLANVDVVKSISSEGVSIVMVMMKVGADVDPIMNEAIRKIQAIKSDLPVSALEPAVSQVSLNALPVMTLGVQADLSVTQLHDELVYRIKPQLSKIDGIGEINLVGAIAREIQVNVDNRKMHHYGLSIMQIVQAIQASNIDFPAGKLRHSEGQTLLRMSAKFNNVTDIENLRLAQMPDGSLLHLRDVAEVIDTQKEPTTLYRVDGTPSVGMQIKKKDDANTVKVNQAVLIAIGQLEEQYRSSNLKFSVPQDASILIMDAVDGVKNDLLMAIALVTVIMILFLHSARNAVIVMVSVPLSLITTFIGMQLFGYSLNLMTLLALSLMIGTLVDDAIVVLENIYRHLEMGKSKWQATLDGVREVNITVISTSLVLMVVFFPVAISESVISPLIEPFAMSIVIAVLVSTFASLTLVPLITSRFSKLEKITGTTLWGRLIQGFESILDRFVATVQALLLVALRRQLLTLSLAAAAFLASLFLAGAGFIGSEFVNAGDMGEGIIKVEYPKDYTLKQNNLLTKKIEAHISRKPEVERIYSSIGSSSGMLVSAGGNYKSEINVKFIDRSERELSSDRLIKDLENELNATFTDVKVRSSIVSMIGGADENPIQIVFQGSNTDSLYAYAEKMKRRISDVPGTNNVKLSIEGGNPELVLSIQKHKATALGVAPEMIGATIQTAYSGNSDAKLQQGSYEYDINVRLDEFDRKNIDDVGNLAVVSQIGEPVKLKQFTNIYEEISKPQLERYGRISSITLESQALGRAVGDVGADIIALIDNTDRPEGITYVLEGDLKYQSDAFGSLGTAILISIVLVYLIMVALYQSYLHPFVVLFTIPLSIIGALLALALTQQSLSIFSLMGIIMLIGLVTKNAILVVDFINTLRSEGVSMLRAIVNGVTLRVRPILMTAVSTVVGMLPIALSQGAGSEWKNGLGWVLIGGISSAMLLSLIVVPVIYLIAEKSKERVAGLIARYKST